MKYIFGIFGGLYLAAVVGAIVNAMMVGKEKHPHGGDGDWEEGEAMERVDSVLTFHVNPEKDVLANLLGCVVNFTVCGIFSRYHPYEKAEKILQSGHFDMHEVYAFEDVTWETVFARMKTVQFSDGYSEPIPDTAFYMDYADFVHNIDTERLISEFGEDAVTLSGEICKEFFDLFMARTFPGLLESSGDFRELLKKMGESVGPLIVEAITKHISSDDNVNSEFLTLLSRTNDLFDKITMDETGLVKMVYASVVKGTEVLICNPEYLQLGDRFNSALKYYVSGASVLIADRFSETLDLGEYKVINQMAPGLLEYLPTVISMMVSMTIIISLDKNPLLIALTNQFNQIPTITGNIALYRKNAEAFEKMAAELAQMDYEELRGQIAFYDSLSSEMSQITDANELKRFLLSYYQTMGKELPWGNRTVEEHWADPSSRLVFR